MSQKQGVGSMTGLAPVMLLRHSVMITNSAILIPMRMSFPLRAL